MMIPRTRYGSEASSHRLSIKSDRKVSKSEVTNNSRVESQGSQVKGGTDDNGPLQLTRVQSILFVSALVYANFTEAACYSLQAPFFPTIAESKGASPAVYGFIFSVLEITSLIASPIIGKLVAYISCNILMQFGIAVSGISIIVFGLTIYVPSGAPFIALCFIIRIIDGFGVACNLTASYSAMAKTFPERIGVVFGIMEVAFSLGSTLGPTVGGLLYEFGGYAFPFMVLGAFLFFGSFINCYCAPKIKTSETRRPVAIMTFLSDFDALVDLAGICIAFMDLGLITVLLEPHLRQFNLTPSILGLVFVSSGLSYAFASPVYGYIVDKGFDPKLMNLLSCPISVIGALLLGPAPFIPIKPQIWLVVVSLVLIGAGEAGRSLCGFVSIEKNTVKRPGFGENIETYGMITSLFLACTSVGFSVGPSIGGLILEASDTRHTTSLLLAFNITMIILLIVNLVLRARRKNRGQIAVDAVPSENVPLLGEVS